MSDIRQRAPKFETVSVRPRDAQVGVLPSGKVGIKNLAPIEETGPMEIKREDKIFPGWYTLANR